MAIKSVYWWRDDTSGSCFRPVVALSLVTSSCGLLYLKRIYIRSGRTKLIPVQALQLSLQRWMHAWTQTTVPNRASRYFLSNRSEWQRGGILGQGNQFFSQGTVPLGAKRLDIDIIGYKLLKTLWEPGIIDCRESLSLFHLFTPIGQGLVVVFLCVWGGLFAFVLFQSLIYHLDTVV